MSEAIRAIHFICVGSVYKPIGLFVLGISSPTSTGALTYTPRPSLDLDLSARCQIETRFERYYQVGGTRGDMSDGE